MNDFQIPDHLLLVLQQVRENYQQPKLKRKRGKPPTYSDLSFLLLCVAAVILRTFDDIELHRLLEHDEIFRLHCAFEQVPHRKTIGIGKNSTIRRAIIDKNARIGKNVQLINQNKIEHKDGETGSYFIREGIILVPKNAVIADGTVI